MALYEYILTTAGMMFLPWHQEWVRGVYGPTDMETGLRLRQFSFTSMAKKQGKSVIMAVPPLIHLGFEDVEMDPEAVGIATTVEQARRVFDSACSFVDRVPELRDMFRIVPTRNTIKLRADERRQYRVLAGDGKKNDGVRCSLGVIDEIHQMTSPSHKANVEAVRRGSRGKKQPLTVIITTAGDPNSSDEWVNWYTLAKHAQQDPAKHPEMHVFIREADQVRIKEDPEYWKSFEARLAANPSHEAHGGFIRDSELEADLKRAVLIPVEYRSYLRYTLNTATQADDQYIAYEKWVECGRVPQRPLMRRPCVVGLDLSVTTDLTALAAVWPDDEGGYDLKVWYWMPSNSIEERERIDKKPYGDWIRNRHIEVTEGGSVNLQAVRAKLHWLREDFGVETVVYDPSHAQDLITQLAYEDGFVCQKQVQRCAKFSSAMKHMNEKILDGKLRHGGDNPVLDWNAQCVVAKQNPNEEIHIVKPDRKKHSTRVDGISATVTALCHAMTLYAYQGPQPGEQEG